MIVQRARLNRSEREQFEREALPHIDRLYGYALRFADDRSQAEDWVQEAYLKAFRGWHSYQPGTNIRAWLLTILRNTIISDRRRKRRVEPVDFAEAERFSLYEQLRETDPEGEFFDGLVSNHVVDALARLPEKLREVVVLSDLEGLSYAEVAEVLGVPLGTVKSRLFRGRRVLQAELYDYGVRTGSISGDANRDGD
jgi:RNA polymerase sigma-70 factor (ECF subfamily)